MDLKPLLAARKTIAITCIVHKRCGGKALKMLYTHESEQSTLVGLEAILAFLFGVLVFSEACSPARIAGVLLITFGIISLRSAF